MSSTNTNLCINCSIGKCCRNLSGLKLSEFEYQKLFAEHSDHIKAEQYAGLYVVSVKKGHPCPYWKDDQCTIYADRPMECRLFPYTLGRVFHRGNRVNITYHSRTKCPDKKLLLMSKADANVMILSFARSVYGDDVKITLEYERFYARWKFRITSLVAFRWFSHASRLLVVTVAKMLM